MTDDLREEREQLEAAIEQREAYNKRLEMEQRCKAETERYYNRTPDPVVTKSAPSTRRDNQAMTNEWQSWIRGEIDRVSKGWVEAQMAAVGEVLIEERKRVAEEHAKMRAEFRAELDSLKIELLQNQLDEARGLPKRPLRVVGAVDVSSAIG